jgi:HTH-type transcriptional regulator/antitoxin HigA
MNSRLENQYLPDKVSPPGETLLEVLESRQMSQAEFAERTGRPKKTINEIVRGKAQITAETAIQFERVLGVPASFWIAREQNYRESIARAKEASVLEEETEWLRQIPYKSLVNLGWVRSHAIRSHQIEELLRFFAVASPTSWKDIWQGATPAFRKSPSFGSEPGAVAAWLRQGEILSTKQTCAKFDEEGFRAALGQIRGLSRDMPRDLPVVIRSLCNAVGVAVAFVPEVSGTRLWGASRWLTSNCALIQLSLRYKTDDHFWFTFFHEAAHILLHSKRDIFLDEEGQQEADQEAEADEFSRNWLIPEFQYKQFCRRGTFTCTAAARFAYEVGISPGIVIGRLQHENLASRKFCNDLKKDVSWIFIEDGE